jgi:hypothetical protein
MFRIEGRLGTAKPHVARNLQSYCDFDLRAYPVIYPDGVRVGRLNAGYSSAVEDTKR